MNLRNMKKNARNVLDRFGQSDELVVTYVEEPVIRALAGSGHVVYDASARRARLTEKGTAWRQGQRKG